MDRKIKILIAVIAIVLLASISALAIRSDLFQGFLSFKRKPGVTLNYPKPPVTTLLPSKMYLYKNRIVSAVTSPVTSVVTSTVPSKVTSNVTSKAGTSKVASNVTSTVASAVTSPVASGVYCPNCYVVDKSKLPQLTGDILKAIAKQNFIANPSKFTLSNQQKQSILNLYKQKYRIK